MPTAELMLPEHVPRPRLLPNPRPRPSAGARLIVGLATVLIASSLTMVSASAVGADGVLLPEPTTKSVDAPARVTEPGDSTEPADQTRTADSTEPADQTEPAALGTVRPAVLATTGSNLIPLGLLAVGLTCIGVSAVMTRRRTVPTVTAQLPVYIDRDAP